MLGSKTKKRNRIIFMTLCLAWPFFFFILNTFILGFNNIIFTFQNFNADGKLIFVGLDNFKTAANLLFNGEASVLRIALKNSLLVWTVLNIVLFPVTMLFSLYMAKKKFFHKGFRFIFMLPNMLSGMVMGLIFIKFIEGPMPEILSELKIFNGIKSFLFDEKLNIQTLISYMIWTSFGTCLIIYPNAMNAIDSNIIEASKMDGASELRQLWHIYLPGIFPTITVMYFTAIVGIFSTDMNLFLFYNYDAPLNTYTMGYYIFNQTMRGGTSMGPVLNAINYLFAFVSVPLTILFKYVMENHGPSEDETKLTKKKVFSYESR